MFHSSKSSIAPTFTRHTHDEPNNVQVLGSTIQTSHARQTTQGHNFRNERILLLEYPKKVKTRFPQSNPS